MIITTDDIDALDEAITRSDGAFSSTSESNQEQDAERLRQIIAALRRGEVLAIVRKG